VPQLAVVLVLSLAFLVLRYSLFLDVESPHFTSPQWDFQHLFWLLQVRVDVALAGGLPHWDHGLGGGHVLLENPQSLAWHPASLAVAALSDSSEALYLNGQRAALLHLAVFMTGIFALAGRLGATWPCAAALALASVLFTESPATRYELGQMNSLAGAAALPWLLMLALSRPVQPRLLHPAGVALATTWLVLCGPHPQNLAIAAVAGFALIYNVTGDGAARYRARLLAYWAYGIVAALALFAPVWIANLQGVLASARWHLGEPLGATYDRALMEPSGILRRLLVPFAEEPVYVEGTLYLGLVLTYCSTIALFAVHRRTALFALGYVALLLLYSMGDETPAHSILLRNIPLLAPSGLPARFLMFIPPLVLLSPIALSTDPSRPLPSTGQLLVVAAAIATAGIAANSTTPLRVAVPFALLMSATAIAICAARGILSRSVAASLLALLVLTEVSIEGARTFAHRYPPREENDFARSDILEHDLELAQVAVRGSPGSRSTHRSLSFGWNPVIPLRHLQYAKGTPTPDYDRTFQPPAWLAPIQNEGPHSFAYVYYRSFSPSNDADLLASLHRRPFDPDLLLLEPSTAGSVVSAPQTRVAVEPARVWIGEDEILLSCKTTRTGAFLFLSTSWNPGWSAAVDGNQVPLIPAFHIFMTLPLGEAGAHEVRLWYEPRYRAAVRAVQGFGMLWVAGGSWWYWRYSRRPGALIRPGGTV